CHYPAVFAAALLNSQPMGFYAPAQIVRDAREHGVEVRPVDINFSDWDCTLEPVADGGEKPVLALRLGLRQVDGLIEDDAQKIVWVRSGAEGLPPVVNVGPPSPQPSPQRGEGVRPYRDVHDLWARAGVRLATIERLA